MEYLVWDFPKEIFKIGNWGPRWYGLMFALGFLVGYSIIQRIFKEEGRKEQDLSSLLYHIMIGTIVGARLGHCLFYAPEQYLKRPIEILFIWEGGLASHGGAIGVLIAVWLFKRKHRDYEYIWLADRLSISVAFAAACIRIGNFFNSEILGRPSTLPWAIIFAQNGDNIPRHPAMLYEALSYLTLSIVLYALYKKTRAQPEGRMIGLMFVWIFSSRFLLEYVKENQVAFETSMPINMGQILSLPFIVLGVLAFSGKLTRWMPG
ncbi:MAG TPA: prolipoprotein diacylglyceryl transferase [Oligoflexus sp.]|uniref:prolipoprotein diacylglyceryl transferase n=1 Tax=Oligoflexus sp. TaxID=1971216 RepID=UPI002D807295|nr:prolipoprotein diacylglyceryl transferase [Oligoflexus sp.]HET9237379.1 prolipoprotein diacylglyceryl transferase [Oligoflexus sp.]